MRRETWKVALPLLRAIWKRASAPPLLPKTLFTGALLLFTLSFLFLLAKLKIWLITEDSFSATSLNFAFAKVLIWLHFVRSLLEVWLISSFGEDNTDEDEDWDEEETPPPDDSDGRCPEPVIIGGPRRAKSCTISPLSPRCPPRRRVLV